MPANWLKSSFLRKMRVTFLVIHLKLTMLLRNMLVNNGLPSRAGHHAHGAPMTEVEQKRQRACLMTLMYAIARSPTGMVRGNPSIAFWSAARAGLASSRQKRKTRRKRLRILKRIIIRYVTNVETIGIENGVIDSIATTRASCKYNYAKLQNSRKRIG